jgi:hypothetical protein
MCIYVISSKNNITNWLHNFLPEVAKIALGPLEINPLHPRDSKMGFQLRKI